jgi:dTMP kinase
MASAHPRLAPLIVIEGIDGTGKSSLAESLARRLRRGGWRVGRWREPSRGALGQAARRASAKDPAQAAFLFTLDRGSQRADLRRLRARSDVVLSDRSFYSTLAYQGSALPPMERSQLERLQRAFAEPPDLVLWLDLPPKEALARVRERGEARHRLEREATLRRVARSYRALARAEPNLFARIDAGGSPAEVLDGAWAALPFPLRRPRPKRRRAHL